MKDIEKTLDKIGIRINTAGYKFLLESLKIKQTNSSLKTDKIYELVAEKCNSTKNKVERNIRYCHEKRQDELKKYFNIDYKINNSVLICLISRELED